MPTPTTAMLRARPRVQVSRPLMSATLRHLLAAQLRLSSPSVQSTSLWSAPTLSTSSPATRTPVT